MTQRKSKTKQLSSTKRKLHNDEKKFDKKANKTPGDLQKYCRDQDS
jgi:hypothetical protein